VKDAIAAASGCKEETDETLHSEHVSTYAAVIRIRKHLFGYSRENRNAVVLLEVRVRNIVHDGSYSAIRRRNWAYHYDSLHACTS